MNLHTSFMEVYQYKANVISRWFGCYSYRHCSMLTQVNIDFEHENFVIANQLIICGKIQIIRAGFSWGDHVRSNEVKPHWITFYHVLIHAFFIDGLLYMMFAVFGEHVLHLPQYIVSTARLLIFNWAADNLWIISGKINTFGISVKCTARLWFFKPTKPFCWLKSGNTKSN